MRSLLPKSGGWVFVKDIIPTVTPVHRFALYYAYPTGKYFWKGERKLANWDDYINDIHPETGRYLDPILEIFGDYENGKKAIANYLKKNMHYDYSPREKEWLDEFGHDKIEKNFPVEEWVKIVTEHGEVSLTSEEYNLVGEDKLHEYFEHVKTEHAFIVYLSKSKQLKGKIADQVFYLRTRGISYTNAIQLCIGEVKTSNLMYLYMHPGYVLAYTRENQFESYVKKHIEYMRSNNMEDEATKYLSQVNQLEGYEKFTVEEVLEPKTAKP